MAVRIILDATGRAKFPCLLDLEILLIDELCRLLFQEVEFSTEWVGLF